MESEAVSWSATQERLCHPLLDVLVTRKLGVRELVTFMVNVTHPVHPHRLLLYCPHLRGIVDVACEIASFVIESSKEVALASVTDLTDDRDIQQDIIDLSFAVYSGEISPLAIHDCLRTFAKPRTSHWLAFVLRHRLAALGTREAILSVCSLLSQMIQPIILCHGQSKARLPARIPKEHFQKELTISLRFARTNSKWNS